METPGFTRYSVESGRRETQRERRIRLLEWGAIAGACMVIAVFLCLLLTGGGA